MKRIGLALGFAVLTAAAVIGVTRVMTPEEPGAIPVPAGATPAATPAAKVLFAEIAASAGLAFTHVSGASGRFYFVEQWGSGAALLDYDNDGWLDVFLAQGGALPGYAGPPVAGNRLFRNVNGRSFVDVAAATGLESRRYTLGVATADYDNDGDTDLFLTALGGNLLYENDGRGRYADVTKRAGVAGTALSTSAAFLDYDNDGRLDLFVARYQDYDLATDRACDRPPSGFPDPPTPPGMAPPSRLEYCGPGRAPVANQLFRNEGGGRFRDVSVSSRIAASKARGLGVAVADFNNDGRSDLFVASDRSPNLLFLNRANGTFAEGAAAAGVAVGVGGIPYAGMGVDAADYDDDGRVDVVITNYEREPTSLYRNRGDGTFADESRSSGLTDIGWAFMKWGVRFADFNGDGRKDLFVANGHIFPKMGEGTPLDTPPARTRKGFAQEAQIALQETPGRFTDRSVEAGPFFTQRYVSRGAASGDIDNDGDMDVLVTNIDGPAVLLRNDTPPTQWARLVLEGVISNRDAIGATVTVTGSGATRHATVSSGGSYLSDHDRRLLFALTGEARMSAEIRWPCGVVTTIPLKPREITRAREAGCVKR